MIHIEPIGFIGELYLVSINQDASTRTISISNDLGSVSVHKIATRNNIQGALNMERPIGTLRVEADIAA